MIAAAPAEGTLRGQVRRPQVRRLVLSEFRTYPALDLPIEARQVVLCGENGAGKTNLLEALSLLSPGRGLRRAELAESARAGGRGGWALSVALTRDEGLGDSDRVTLGAGYEPSPEGGLSRPFRIDGAPAGSANAFADHVRVVWLTPAMDHLFAGPASERRRFLDRLVLAVDSSHGARVNGLERALRNRNRLLEDSRPDARWLEAAEREVAELGVAVAAARVETLTRLSWLIAASRNDASPFPFADVALTGEVEALLTDGPALAAEEAYRQMLRDSRSRDAAAGRTLNGPHRSDLAVMHGPKQMEAARCSTGEQKALLVGLVLAHARLVAEMSGMAPLVLLDEVAAHFDPLRRGALFETLAGLGGQVWMTGADPQAFADVTGDAQHLRVTPGRVDPASPIA